MSFFDKVKSATGLGLTPDEGYHRAYEKGVLLGKYDAASEMFDTAAAKFEEIGETEKAHRSRANQFLYKFVGSKDLAVIDKILPHLKALQEIEELGSETERVSATELATELEARKFENAAFGSSKKPQEALDFHTRAADLFQKILRVKLKTYKMVPAADHNDTAEERFFLHSGHAAFCDALQVQDADPVAAGEKLSEAAQRFKRAKDEGLRSKVDGIIGNLRLKRTCWFCHREMQGLNLNVGYYQANITRYGSELVSKLGQDTATVNYNDQIIAVCLPCATMIQHQADQFARARMEEVRAEMKGRFNEVISAINALIDRISHLESVSHRH